MVLSSLKAVSLIGKTTEPIKVLLAGLKLKYGTFYPASFI